MISVTPSPLPSYAQPPQTMHASEEPSLSGTSYSGAETEKDRVRFKLYSTCPTKP